MADSFFTELKRRNVFKVGVAYLVLAWVVIQIADVVVPALSLPSWTITLLVVLGIFGFPFAIFFAWAFEITPDGIKKESDITPEESITSHTGRKLDFTIIGLLVVALGYFIYESRFEAPTEDVALTETTGQKNIEGSSIAVLPFVNMSSDKEQEYFSDGISEELLNLLAKIPNLKVAARTSSFQFKGKNQDIQNIASQLGVKTILEGSIRKSGTKVRITAQLIKADDGFHMWSETYDRELDDIFKVQDEISAAIVGALKTTLGIELVKTASTVQSIDHVAYDFYLKGLKSSHDNSFDNLASAVNSFQSALKIEPDFLMAKIKLAETYTLQITTGSRFDRVILDTADNLIANSLATTNNDTAAEAFYVRAYIALRKDERDLSSQFIKKAYQLEPNNINIMIFNAQYRYREIGVAKAKQLFERALQLDPLNPKIPFSYGRFLKDSLQDFSEAEKAYKTAIRINPNNPNYYSFLSGVYVSGMADLVAGIKLTTKSNKLDPNDPDYLVNLSSYYLSLGDEQNAMDYADAALTVNVHYAGSIWVKAEALIYTKQFDEVLKLINASLDDPETVYRGATIEELVNQGIYVLLLQNNLTEAEALINKHLPEISTLIDLPLPSSAEDLKYLDGTALLAIIYQAQGKHEKATKLANRLTLFDETFFLKGAARLNSYAYYALAIISAAQANDDKTLDYLEAMIDFGQRGYWRWMTTQSPFFLTLHQQPRFIALVERLEADMLKQRAILEADSRSDKNAD